MVQVQGVDLALTQLSVESGTLSVESCDRAVQTFNVQRSTSNTEFRICQSLLPIISMLFHPGAFGPSRLGPN
jgi:hypothetical protein